MASLNDSHFSRERSVSCSRLFFPFFPSAFPTFFYRTPHPAPTGGKRPPLFISVNKMDFRSKVLFPLAYQIQKRHIHTRIFCHNFPKSLVVLSILGTYATTQPLENRGTSPKIQSMVSNNLLPIVHSCGVALLLSSHLYFTFGKTELAHFRGVGRDTGVSLKD